MRNPYASYAGEHPVATHAIHTRGERLRKVERGTTGLQGLIRRIGQRLQQPGTPFSTSTRPNTTASIQRTTPRRKLRIPPPGGQGYERGQEDPRYFGRRVPISLVPDPEKWSSPSTTRLKSNKK